MENFDLKKSSIGNAVRLRSIFLFKFAGPLKKIFFFLFSLVFFTFLYGFFSNTMTISGLSFFLGWSFLAFSIYSFFQCAQWFFDHKARNPKLFMPLRDALSSNVNLAEFLSFDSAYSVDKAIGLAERKKIPVNSSILFFGLLKNNKNINFIFSRILVDVEDLKKFLKDHLSDPSGIQGFEKSVLEAARAAQKKGRARIETGDLLIGLAKHNLIFQKILLGSDLKVSDIENLTWWLDSLTGKISQGKKFWKWNNLIRKGSLGKAWSAGFTVTLDRFGTDLSESVMRAGFPEMVGHEKEIESVERILCGKGLNNCLLVGEPGVGKKSMMLELARKSVLGESLPDVNNKRVVELDLSSLAAQASTDTEVAVILDKIFQEAVAAGNIILVIDDFHDFVGGRARPGVIDISGVISPYLNLSAFQIVAISTFAGLHKEIEQRPGLLSMFEKVEVEELSSDETLMVLENTVPYLERRYAKFITFPALRQIILLADKYFPIPFPKSAMDLLDEVLVYVTSMKDKVVLSKHVDVLVSGKAQVPVGNVEEKEKEILLNLEDLIHEKIINQAEAVGEIATALRRARSKVTVRKGPMGTFLFLGPTGVGKTETAKALSEIYFGAEDKMIRLDMSEFQSVSDVPRLLGSPGEEGVLTTQVREKPFSLVLLDEIEKAHPNILNLFLQVLDEGFLTDGLGRKVDFKNCIIIATSNAGYQIILKALKERMQWSNVKKEILDYLFAEGLFRPEFINRFDSMVVFQPLSQENLVDIAGLMLNSLKRNLEEQNVELVVTDALKARIAELGYNPTFGAREMRRVIQDKVENILASALLSGALKKGSRVEVNPEDFSLKLD
ncbi:MAG: ATP-dependent Clp protease ATP-binding subunit [Candidatus Paceibacterota bacterium]|jgi:ATP-dependent Clp protease ATP-binding subunit ClpA